MRLTAPSHFIMLAALSATGAHASEAEDNNRLYRSVHFLGRGDTGIAIADDEDAIFYNPAGIASGKGLYKKTVLVSPQIEVSEATKDLARQLGAQNANVVDAVSQHIGKPNHAGVQNFTGLVLRRAALGVIVSSNADVLAYKSPAREDGGLEVLEAGAVQNAGATFSLADSLFGDSLLFGVTGKYLERGRGFIRASAAEADKVKQTLGDQSKFIALGTGGGADAGLMWRPITGRTPLSFGLTIHEIGDTKIIPQKPTTLDLNLKQTIDVGVAIEPSTKFSKAKILVDLHDLAGRVVKNPRKKLHVGAEISVLDTVGVMAGLNQGYPAVGLYADLWIIRLDLSTYTEELGDRVGTRPDPRYALRLTAGF